MKSLASVGAPEPQQILIRPYDPSTIKEIERVEHRLVAFAQHHQQFACGSRSVALAARVHQQ